MSSYPGTLIPYQHRLPPTHLLKTTQVKNLAGWLDESGVVEDDDGTRVALLIIAENPHQ